MSADSENRDPTETVEPLRSEVACDATLYSTAFEDLPISHADAHDCEAPSKDCEEVATCVEKPQDLKRKADDGTEIQSFNDWEHADIGGDDSRKSKFLRLMGANKKEHKGRFVIGDKVGPSPANTRTNVETEKLTENLESQFCQGLDHKLSGAARRHTGLGFRASPPPQDIETSGGSHEAPQRHDKDRGAEGVNREERGEWRERRTERHPEKQTERDRSEIRGGDGERDDCERGHKNDGIDKDRTETRSVQPDRSKFTYGFVKSSENS